MSLNFFKKSCYTKIKFALCLTLVLTILCGCSKSKKTSASGTNNSNDSGTQDTTTQAEPVTLEQVLLKNRGISYDKSDYKKFLGGENIINEYAEFDCNTDHSYSKDINDLVISDGKLYQANFNTVLSNGKNIQELGALPGKDVMYCRLTYDGEMGSIYLKNGTGYKLSGAPVFQAMPLNKSSYPLFKKVYRYEKDGKTLKDHTAEFLKADKIYDNGTPMIAFMGKKVSLLFSGKYLDKGTTEWNWYRDMGWREYIAFDLDLSAIGGETPVRLFNNNILMTNCAFYEIVYASKPLDDSDKKAQLAPDESVSPYYPAVTHLNCNLTLRKITLLSNYYSDVRNISTSYVITDNFTVLPISEIITEGYSNYNKYSCNGFYWGYIKQ